MRVFPPLAGAIAGPRGKPTPAAVPSFMVCPRELSSDSPDFPAPLVDLPGAPRRLWVAGSLDPSPAVAIVGARECTRYGREVATRLAVDLARAGIVVVSGLARGIDAAAHRGAMAGGGRTIAVLPGGIDRLYPRRHRALASAITRAGALVTEHPPGTPVGPWSFPRRNRIIAGLSLAVVVVEAAERSGARITADLALTYQREVLVVPGPITSPVSAGCHRLLDDGAAPCTSADDVIAALPAEVAIVARARATARVRAGRGSALEGGSPGLTSALSDEESRLLAVCKERDPTSVDRLLARTGLPLPSLLQALTGLEVRGLLRIVGERVGLIRTSGIR